MSDVEVVGWEERELRVGNGEDGPVQTLKLFVCCICRRELKKKVGLASHMRRHGRYYKCRICEPGRSPARDKLKTERELGEHFLFYHEEILKKDRMSYVSICYEELENIPVVNRAVTASETSSPARSEPAPTPTPTPTPTLQPTPLVYVYHPTSPAMQPVSVSESSSPDPQLYYSDGQPAEVAAVDVRMGLSRYVDQLGEDANAVDGPVTSSFLSHKLVGFAIGVNEEFSTRESSFADWKTRIETRMEALEQGRLQQDEVTRTLQMDNRAQLEKIGRTLLDIHRFRMDDWTGQVVQENRQLKTCIQGKDSRIRELEAGLLQTQQYSRDEHVRFLALLEKLNGAARQVAVAEPAPLSPSNSNAMAIIPMEEGEAVEQPPNPVAQVPQLQNYIQHLEAQLGDSQARVQQLEVELQTARTHCRDKDLENHNLLWQYRNLAGGQQGQ